MRKEFKERKIITLFHAQNSDEICLLVWPFLLVTIQDEKQRAMLQVFMNFVNCSKRRIFYFQ